MFIIVKDLRFDLRLDLERFLKKNGDSRFGRMI